MRFRIERHWGLAGGALGAVALAGLLVAVVTLGGETPEARVLGVVIEGGVDGSGVTDTTAAEAPRPTVATPTAGTADPSSTPAEAPLPPPGEPPPTTAAPPTPTTAAAPPTTEAPPPAPSEYVLRSHNGAFVSILAGAVDAAGSATALERDEERPVELGVAIDLDADGNLELRASIVNHGPGVVELPEQRIVIHLEHGSGVVTEIPLAAPALLAEGESASPAATLAPPQGDGHYSVAATALIRR